jgi:hypothetical protein
MLYDVYALGSQVDLHTLTLAWQHRVCPWRPRERGRLHRATQVRCLPCCVRSLGCHWSRSEADIVHEQTTPASTSAICRTSAFVTKLKVHVA